MRSKLNHDALQSFVSLGINENVGLFSADRRSVNLWKIAKNSISSSENRQSCPSTVNFSSEGIFFNATSTA